LFREHGQQLNGWTGLQARVTVKAIFLVIKNVIIGN
jgi:hypothetical protein